MGSQDDVPLVGRERELTVLREAVTSAAAGQPRAVLVAGEAGGGKSRLVRALLDGSPETSVLRAQCVDLGDPGLPNLAMVDLVRGVQAMAEVDPEVASALEDLPAVAGMTDLKEPGKGHRVGNVEFLARTDDTPFFNLAIIVLRPGQGVESHRHAAEDDSFLVLEGTLSLTVSEDDRMFRPGRARSCWCPRARRTPSSTPGSTTYGS